MNDADRISYPIEDAAAAVGLSAKTLRRAQAEGELRFYYVTSKPVVLREELIRWITTAPTERPSAAS